MTDQSYKQEKSSARFGSFLKEQKYADLKQLAKKHAQEQFCDKKRKSVDCHDIFNVMFMLVLYYWSYVMTFTYYFMYLYIICLV